VLADYDACRRIATRKRRGRKAEGLGLLELRFSPYYGGPTNLDRTKVGEAGVDGVEEGRTNTS